MPQSPRKIYKRGVPRHMRGNPVSLRNHTDHTATLRAKVGRPRKPAPPRRRSWWKPNPPFVSWWAIS